MARRRGLRKSAQSALVRCEKGGDGQGCFRRTIARGRSIVNLVRVHAPTFFARQVLLPRVYEST